MPELEEAVGPFHRVRSVKRVCKTAINRVIGGGCVAVSSRVVTDYHPG